MHVLFAELSTRQLKRLAVTSVGELVDAISAYSEHRNREPKPFVWTATVEHILTKVNKANQILALDGASGWSPLRPHLGVPARSHGDAPETPSWNESTSQHRSTPPLLQPCTGDTAWVSQQGV